MTRKELLNSPEYWQGIAENQCYRENIDYTLQLVDKKQMIDKVCKWIEEHLYDEVYLFRNEPFTWEHIDDLSILISDLKKAMEESDNDKEKEK